MAPTTDLLFVLSEAPTGLAVISSMNTTTAITDLILLWSPFDAPTAAAHGLTVAPTNNLKAPNNSLIVTAENNIPLDNPITTAPGLAVGPNFDCGPIISWLLRNPMLVRIQLLLMVMLVWKLILLLNTTKSTGSNEVTSHLIDAPPNRNTYIVDSEESKSEQDEMKPAGKEIVKVDKAISQWC